MRKKLNFEILGILIVVMLVVIFNFLLSIYGGREVIPVGGDDKLFGQFLTNYGYWGLVKIRYTTWSSRVIIELILSVLVHHPIIWRVLNSIVMFVVIFIPYYYVIRGKNDKRNFVYLIVSAALFFMIRVEMLNQAGWMATTTNYLWVLAAAEVAIIPNLRRLKNQKNSLVIYFLSIFALVYACNQEQMAGIMFLALFSIIGYLAYTKKQFNFELIQIMITGTSLLAIILAPGNGVRKIAEMKRMPLLQDISIFKKIELGFSSTMGHFFFNFQMLSFILCIVLFLAICQKNIFKYKVTNLIFLIPSIFIMLFAKQENTTFKFLPINSFFANSVKDYGVAIVKGNLITWIPDIALIFLSIVLIVGIYLIGDKSVASLIVVLILILGFISRVIMGFSPTVWASGPRTFMFMYESIIVAILYVISQMRVGITKNIVIGSTIIIGAIYFYSFIQVI